MITKLFAVRLRIAEGLVDYSVASRLWIGSIPVAVFFAAISSFGNHNFKIEWLTQAVGIMVFFAGIATLFSPALIHCARSLRLSQPRQFKFLQPFLTVLTGAITGACVALTSVGAGALGASFLLMLYPLRMTPSRLIATDLLHAIPLSFVAGFVYFQAGFVDLDILGSLLLGSIPSVYIFSKISSKINHRILKILLGICLVVLGYKAMSL